MQLLCCGVASAAAPVHQLPGVRAVAAQAKAALQCLPGRRAACGGPAHAGSVGGRYNLVAWFVCWLRGQMMKDELTLRSLHDKHGFCSTKA